AAVRGLPGCTRFPYTTLLRSVEVRGRYYELARCDYGSRHARRCVVHAVGSWRSTHALTYITSGAPMPSRPNASASVWRTRSTSRSEEHTSELQSRENLVCRLL